MTAFTINVKDLTTPGMDRLQASLRNRKAMNKTIADFVLPVVKRKMDENSRTNKNRFGARGGFWTRMKEGTIPIATDDAAIIRMPEEMNLRVHGGTVTPTKSKYLAIPARKQAYGKSPRDFNDLRFAPLFGRGKGGALIQREQQKISFNKKTGKIRKGKKLGGEVFYWLKPSATIRGNEDLIPSEDELYEGVKKGLNRYLRDTGTKGALA